MKQSRTYVVIAVLLGVLAGLAGCTETNAKRITFWRNDKKAYGTYVAHDWLPSLFPGATLVDENKQPSAYSIYREDENSDAKKLKFILTQEFYPSPPEWQTIMSDVAAGTDYFISALELSGLVEDSLGVKLRPEWLPMMEPLDSLTVDVKDVGTEEYTAYSFPGYRLASDITEMDTVYTSILGRNGNGNANFVKFHYINGGNIYLHTAPGALTNFFLLHKQNHAYFERVFSSIADDKDVIAWNDYFRHHREGAGKNFSGLGVLWSIPALSWMVIMILVLFGCLFLFETKRKESVILLSGQKRNSSLDFMQTVAALYYQRRDNKNLGEKMIVHFADHIQRHYFLRLQPGEASFIIALSGKSGVTKEQTEQLCYYMKMIRDYPQVSEELLTEMYLALQAFYKNEKNGRTTL